MFKVGQKIKILQDGLALTNVKNGDILIINGVQNSANGEIDLITTPGGGSYKKWWFRPDNFKHIQIIEKRKKFFK